MSDLFQNHAAKPDPVECLGQTFSSDQARRVYYLKLLAEKLKDSAFRKIEGFPIGSDEDIMALSDPPYYTACPNPFIEDFVRHYGKPYDSSVPYSKEPFAADVSEGKNDPVYLAHSYHTKVPHKAIMRYILHYTSPGDVVLDGFCGTGMTGVAAQMCGDSSEVASLGYQVGNDGTIFELDSSSAEKEWKPISKLGARVTVLNDLSPAASFIAFNYNSPQDPVAFANQAGAALRKVELSCAWMFQTLHAPTKDQINSGVQEISSTEVPDLSRCGSVARINYTLWSDVFSCQECAGELIFWDAAVNPETNQVMDEFSCPHCSAQLNKKNVERVWVSKLDSLLGRVVRQVKQVPALISYVHNRQKREKKPDEADLALLQKIDSYSTTLWQPNYPMMFKGENWGDTWRSGIHAGITHVHHFYSRRNLLCLAQYRAVHQSLPHAANITSTAVVASRLYRFRSQNGSLGAGGGPMSGTLYLPSLVKEIPVLKLLNEHIEKATKLRAVLGRSTPRITNTGSMSGLSLPDNSIDYIFLDPPFGSNIMYSELNFMWESWLKVFTNTGPEAIENKSQSKTIIDYRKLMTKCFSEAFRVLKPGRWMTVEFSNTQAAVWNSIQTSLQEAGFVVANVSVLDKKQGSFKSVTTTTAVKQDLIISAYKPDGDLEERFATTGGSIDSVWDFARTHLQYLPRVKTKGQELDFISERDPRIIFDRMIAWFVRHNQPVPMSTQEFQAGLLQRFVERDGMIFLHDQVAEYDKKRAQSASAPQMEMFVSDERSAIDWLNDFLKRRPSTYQQITTEFMEQLSGGWKKHEAKPELSALLEDNFLKFDGTGEVTSQIHSYLSTNHKDLRGLEKNSPVLLAKAKDRWYVPNSNKAQDLEKKREKALLKEFDGYKAATGRKLKEFRLEVLRAGFKVAWGEKNYKAIIAIAQKIPEETLQEDEKLLLWYDQALTRTEAGA